MLTPVLLRLSFKRSPKTKRDRDTMKTKFRKIAAFVLSLTIILTINIPAMAARSYNANAALAYAKSHWNDGKGLCAEFVYSCLNAGGLPLKRTTLCSGLKTQLAQLEKDGYCTGNWLTVEKSGYILVSKNKDILSPGDPIFFNCPHETDGKPFVHVIIYSGQDAQGRLKCYAHNDAMNNETTRLLNCGSCGKPLSGAYVFHMNGSGSASAAKPVTLSASAANISLDLSGKKSQTVTLKIGGDVPQGCTLSFGSSNSTVAFTSQGNYTSGYSIPMVITARSTGKCTVTYTVKDPNEKVLAKTVVNVTVTAPSYKVTYNANGGSGTPAAQTKTYQKTLTLSGTQPARKGYTFSGWATSSSGSVQYHPGDSYTANQSITLYAVWTPVPAAPSDPQYFDCNVKIECAKGKTVNLYNNPGDSTRVDYFDRGQSMESTCGAKLSNGSTWYKITAKNGMTGAVMDVWLKYESGKMTVKDNIPAPKEVTLSASPSLVSLDLASKKSQTVTLQLSGDVPADCVLSREASDSNMVAVSWGAYKEGFTAPAIVTAKSAGVCTITFSAKSKGTGETLATASVKVTVTAPSHTVRYDANGGEGAPAAQTKAYRETLYLSSAQPSRTGYAFSGWTTSPNGSVQYYPGDAYTEDRDTTFYAVWTASPSTPAEPVTLSVSTSKVSLEMGGKESQEITLQLGGDLPADCRLIHTTSNSNIVSMDWGTVKNPYIVPGTITAKMSGSCTITFSATKSTTGEVLATASVEVIVTPAASTYTVRYDANGGTDAPSAQTKTAQKPLTLSNSQPTRSGYTFEGWAISSSGPVQYRPGGSYTEDQDITLYAVWTEIPPAKPVTLSASTNKVSLDMDSKKSQTITLYLGGDVPEGCRLNCFISDPDVVSSSWGNYKDGYTVPVAITAKKAGMTAINYSVIDEVTGKLLTRIPVVVVVSAAKPVEPSGPQYFNCNVRIDCVKGKTVNLYRNPGDSSRVDYFDLGQTMWSGYGVKMPDGSTWYQGRVISVSTPMDVWLKYESSKMTVTDIGS